MRDYPAIARQYASDVVGGLIPACKYVKLACQRQLNDLDRGGWQYKFDEDRASHICRLVEKLAHIKGEWRGRPIVMEPWQIFNLTAVFGWIDGDGYRRFKTVYNEVPRKNAKSTLTSGVGLYMLSADNEGGAEVYSAATTRDQAKIVWQDAKRMAELSPGLQRRFGVKVTANSIYVPHTDSYFKPLSRDQGGNLDGLNVHGGLIDELHAHKTREVFDVIETGTGARRQSLLWLITTAGFNRAGICYEQRAYLIKVLTGIAVDEEYFGIIYTVDDEDLENEERLYTDPEIWAKANPNWGVSVNPADVARKARKALQTPSARHNFLTKHLNVWVNADSAWMDLVSWERCGDQAMDLDQFEGQEIYVAVDLASKLDIASVAIVFERDGEVYGFVKNYLPEDAAEEGRNSQYSGWVETGQLIATPGSVTDYAWIEEDIRYLGSKFKIKELLIDPWQASYLGSRLMNEGVNVVEFNQTVKTMSESMKELEALVVSKKFKHCGCSVLTWMVSNVVCHIDAKDNIYPRKEFPENKIDGVIALIMALKRAYVDQQVVKAPPGVVLI